MKLNDFLILIKNGTCPEGELRIRGVYDFKVKDKHLKSILPALLQPNNVRKLILESDLTTSGIQQLARSIETNTQIEYFEIWNNQFKFTSENQHLDYFVPVLENNKTLKHFTLSGIGARFSSTTAFFNALKTNKHLTFLSIYSSGFTHEETAQEIATVLGNNKILETLSLNGHCFGTVALKIIVDALLLNHNLKALDLSSSYYVGNEGAIACATVISRNIHLQSLRLFDSNITATGASALADSLLTNKHLTRLDLGCNTFDQKATLAFAKTLETNTTLRDLTIASYSVGKVGVKAFADLLESNHSLTKFDYTPFWASGSKEDKQRLQDGLSRNTLILQRRQAAQVEFFDLIKMLFALSKQKDCLFFRLPHEILILIAAKDDEISDKLDLPEEVRIELAYTMR